jgi:pseudaminic acid biosynthesis-associated methylase
VTVTQFATEQEQFWAGGFGDDYAGRNVGADWLASTTALFSRVLARTRGVTSVVELGANVGLNVRALATLLPAAKLAAVEINATAVEALRSIPGLSVVHGSLLQYEAENAFDLAFVKGVLIHVAPEELGQAYDVLYRASRRYVLIAEYYNPTPVEVPYRGHSGKLFKRDFAGEMMDRHKDLSLVDYGFVWRRDPNFPQDDLTWFLMSK